MNIYYGDVLTKIGEIELRGESWEFDILAIWVDSETGIFYGARSSGCSCPVPFDEYDSVESLDNLGKNPHNVRNYIMKNESYYDDPASLISAVMGWNKTS